MPILLGFGAENQFEDCFFLTPICRVICLVFSIGTLINWIRVNAPTFQVPDFVRMQASDNDDYRDTNESLITSPRCASCVKVIGFIK